ncbi:MAG TPA: hypothetical protein VI299_16120, partial [Polyangiales bacterium]
MRHRQLLLAALITACSDDGASTETRDASPQGSDSGTPVTPRGGRYFPDGAFMYQRVDRERVDPDSNTITRWLQDNGGWGTGQLRIDFSIEVLEADASTPKRAFEQTDDFYSPDCDSAPFPVPVGGALEGEDGYSCTSDGDCHLLVFAPAE